jgi:hypothetical protein
MRGLALLSLAALAGASQPVPAAVEHQIAARAGLESYTPARMLTGWHYVRWHYVPGELRVWFTNRSNLQVKFDVTPLHTANCADGRQKTFQLAGSKVYWSQVTDPTVEYQQQAWRCVKHPSGRWLRLVASSQVPPTKLADVGLGRVVASGRLIR